MPTASATARRRAGRPGTTVRTGPGAAAFVSVPLHGRPPVRPRGVGQAAGSRPIGAIPDAAFLLIAGDLVDRGNERTNWDHFFLRAAGVFERLPLMPCVGNHEYLDQGPRLYRAFFDLPRNGPAGDRSEPRLFVRIWQRLRRRPRQHPGARRCRHGPEAGRVARRGPRADACRPGSS